MKTLLVGSVLVLGLALTAQPAAAKVRCGMECDESGFCVNTCPSPDDPSLHPDVQNINNTLNTLNGGSTTTTGQENTPPPPSVDNDDQSQ